MVSIVSVISQLTYKVPAYFYLSIVQSSALHLQHQLDHLRQLRPRRHSMALPSISTKGRHPPLQWLPISVNRFGCAPRVLQSDPGRDLLSRDPNPLYEELKMRRQ